MLYLYIFPQQDILNDFESIALSSLLLSHMTLLLIWTKCMNIRFITVHGLNEGHIAGLVIN